MVYNMHPPPPPPPTCLPLRAQASSENTLKSTRQCNADETPDGTFDVCERDALTSRLVGMSVLEAQAPETLHPASGEVPARYSIARNRSGQGTRRISSSLTRNRPRKEGPIACASARGSDRDTAMGTRSSLVVEQMFRGIQDSTALLEGCDPRFLSCRRVPAGCRGEGPGAPKRRSNFEQVRLLTGDTGMFPADDVDRVGEVKSCLEMHKTERRQEEHTDDGKDDDDDDQVLLCQPHISGTKGIASEYFDPAEDDGSTAHMEGDTDVASCRVNRSRINERRHAVKGSPRDGQNINKSPPAKNTTHSRLAPSRATRLARSLLKRVWNRVSPADRSEDGLSLCKAVILQSGDDECNNVLHERSGKNPRSTIDISATTMAPFGDMGANQTSMALPWCAVASTECASNMGPPISDSAEEHLAYRTPHNDRSSNLHRDENAPQASCSATDLVLNQQQCLLLLLRHTAESCSAEDGGTGGCTCAVSSHCATVRKLWDHVAVCMDTKCPVSFDRSADCCCYRLGFFGGRGLNA